MSEAALATQYGSALPIAGVDELGSRAIIANLIFSSAWMGALGWECVMSMNFDVQLIRQTDWRSVPSTIHTLAYYVSRYATLAFITLFVAINGQTVVGDNADDVCQARITAAASLFVLSHSSILLVFTMRTIALWNLSKRATIPLALSWLAAAGVNLTIPIKGRGVVSSMFCAWSIDGAWIGASMIVVAVSAFFCLVLTVVKLNRRGWRGLVQSMLHTSNRSIDAEDVSHTLVQRTTIFFFVMLTSIIVADIVYFTVNFSLWQLIAVPAYMAVSCSLAGRIFRKSWKMTRSIQYTQPPSYFPGVWTRTNDEEGLSPNSHQRFQQPHVRSTTLADSFAGANALYLTQSQETFSFVEGQFRHLNSQGMLSTKSLTLQVPEKTSKDVLGSGAEQSHEYELPTFNAPALRRASEPCNLSSSAAAAAGGRYFQPFNGLYCADDEIQPAPLTQVVLDRPMSTAEYAVLQRDLKGAFGISATPAFVPRGHMRNSTKRQSGHRYGGSHAAHQSPHLLQTPRGRSKRTQRRPATEPSRTQPIPSSSSQGRIQAATVDQASLWSESPSVATSRPATGSSADASTSRSDLRWSMMDLSTMPTLNSANVTPSLTVSPVTAGTPTARDDLAATPTRPRLWLDSSAERARMEAAASRGDGESLYGGSQSESSTDPSYAGSTRTPRSTASGSRRGNSSKRNILESASEAGETLTQKGHGRRRIQGLNEDLHRSDDDPPLRSSYLTSPAIVSNRNANDLRADRNNFDLDAIRRSLTTPKGKDERKSSAMDETVHVISADPSTVPFGESSRSNPQAATLSSPAKIRSKSTARPRTAPSKVSEQAQEEQRQNDECMLDAFRHVVDEDLDGLADGDRPRTSRGSRSGQFGVVQRPFGLAAQSPTFHREDGRFDRQSPATRVQRTTSMYDERPKTRNGGEGGSEVKPFNAQAYTLRSPSSAIEEQYRKLEALATTVDSHEGQSTQSPAPPMSGGAGSATFGKMAPLERIDSRSTEEGLA